MTVTSPFEYSYLSGVLSYGKSGLYWVGASGGPNHWSWVTGESTSYARTISAYGYTMDSCGSYFSGLGNHLAYCPGLAYSISNYPKVSNIKGYICEWEPGVMINDEDAGIFSANIAGSTVVVLKAALSASSNIDSDNDGIPDWQEIDHKTIEKLGGKTSDVSVKWKNAQNYINNTQKLAGEKTEELSKKIALVHDGNKKITPAATNPGDDDSDGDGYKDKFDPRPNINDIYVTKLSNDYIMVDYSTADTSDKVTGWKNETAESDKNHISYGGAQRWFRGLENDIPDDDKREYLASQGCGLIAMADLALYLARRNPNVFGNSITETADVANPIDFNKYKEYILEFEKKYVNLHSPELNIQLLKPAIGLGTSTILVPGDSINIAYGDRFDINSNDGNMGKILTKYFKDNDINYKAKWCISDDLVIKDIWSTRIKGLISRDIPAIIAIGPTSEDDIDKDGVKLYSRSKDDIYKKAVYNDCTYVKNHYFNVTAVIEDNVRKEINHFDGVMYEVSSWGSKYYMSEKEMNDFIENHTPLFTNLVYIKEK